MLFGGRGLISNSSKISVCLLCGSAGLQELSDFGSLSRITSDCRPFRPGGRIATCNICGGIQKLCDSKWLSEVKEIYSTYSTYSVVGPLDQMVLDPKKNILRPRCAVLSDQLTTALNLAECGAWLDYGCGRGAMLEALSNILPNWQLNGVDLDKQQLSYLRSIKGFKRLYDADQDKINETFDMVSMVHSLEHFANPFNTLLQARKLLTEHGRLFIQVNDTQKNPFELVVADHLTHFTPETLCQIVRRAGFEVTMVTSDWITKELSLLAKPQRALGPSFRIPHSRGQPGAQVLSQLQWLMDLVEIGKASSSVSRIGIFGSSIAATWLNEHLQDQVLFFVDEDPAKAGKTHVGKPIYTPSQVKPGSQVLIGLIPEIATAVYDRLQTLPIRFILPNPLVFE